MPLVVGIIMSAQYRLSRVHTAGDDYQTYNKVILFAPYGASQGAKFVEGFAAAEFIIEGTYKSFQFRKQTVIPVELYQIGKFTVVGDYRATGPQLRSWLSFTLVPWGLQVTDEYAIFNCRFMDCDASYGEDLEAYNSDDLGTSVDITFYDRDVRTVNGQRNLLTDRRRIVPTPPPEGITEILLETL